MRALVLAAALGLAVAPGVASAQACTPPAPPPTRPLIVFPTEPAPPSCVNVGAGTHRCTGKVLNDYNAKIDAFNERQQAAVDQINKYTKSLRDYLNSASDFAECEQDAMRAQLRRGKSSTNPES